ncbi:FecR family protein [Lysobacter sp. CA199]|uniref:FecR family protein n=1 Tax=Lysobacter sp. CA199 TaxID=3455608 RepID=UPI003F8CF755
MAESRQIEQAAAEWLVRRDGGDWSAQAQSQLDAWLTQSTAHRVAFVRLSAAWDESDRLKALAAGTTAGEAPARAQWASSPFAGPAEARTEQAQDSHGEAMPARADALVFAPRARARRRHGARYVAVAAAVLVAVSLWWGWWQYGAVEHASYRTAMGATDTVPMADGSRATLSSDSSIDVALSRGQRRVELRRGEAFFDVTKDPRRPFAVEAGGRRVVAVGTHFSVRRDGGELRVVVTEGTVRLESQPIGGHDQPTTLLPAGSIALAGPNGVLVRSVSVEEAERYVDWRNGYLVFRDTPLAVAAAEFNRYNARKLVIGDAAAGQLRVGGNFRWSNAEVFVGLLEQAMPVRVERLEDRIVLHSR